MITDEARKRYARQILMIGEAGQERLKAARVLVAGAGGLGTVISLYLAAAGVGHLRIIDCDVVETSNLNRQILHWSGDVGRPKTASVEEKLAALNPLIRIETVSGRIAEESIAEMARGCDLIVDAMDNFPTRYLLNRTAVEKLVPFIHGAVRGFFGQATTVIPGETPCLRCLFPESPPREVFPIIGATCGSSAPSRRRRRSSCSPVRESRWPAGFSFGTVSRAAPIPSRSKRIRPVPSADS